MKRKTFTSSAPGFKTKKKLCQEEHKDQEALSLFPLAREGRLETNQGRLKMLVLADNHLHLVKRLTPGGGLGISLPLFFWGTTTARS
jgi:hypothetical protein